eukprot:76775_1
MFAFWISLCSLFILENKAQCITKYVNYANGHIHLEKHGNWFLEKHSVRFLRHILSDSGVVFKKSENHQPIISAIMALRRSSRTRNKVNYSQSETNLGRIPRQVFVERKLEIPNQHKTFYALMNDANMDLGVSNVLDFKPLNFTHIGRVDNQGQLFGHSVTGEGSVDEDIMLKNNCYWEYYSDLVDKHTNICVQSKFITPNQIKLMSLNDNNESLHNVGDEVAYVPFFSNQTQCYRARVIGINLHSLCGQFRGEYTLQILEANSLENNPIAMAIEIKPYDVNINPWKMSEEDIILILVRKSIKCGNLNYVNNCGLKYETLPLDCIIGSALFGMPNDYNRYSRLIARNWTLCETSPYFNESILIVTSELNKLLDKTFRLTCKFDMLPLEKNHNLCLNKTNIIKYSEYTNPYKFDFRYKIFLEKCGIELFADRKYITFSMNLEQIRWYLKRSEIIQELNGSGIILTSDIVFKLIRKGCKLLVHSFNYKAQKK